MGTVLSSLFGSRKRSREADDEVNCRRTDDAPTAPVDATSSGGAPQAVATGARIDDSPDTPRSAHLRRLRYRCAPAEAVGRAVCRHIAADTTTQRTYGCHAHLYETDTAAESHGVALAWCVEAAAPLSPLALLSLCRVANSCRKKTLVTSAQGEALILTYTATL